MKKVSHQTNYFNSKVKTDILTGRDLQYFNPDIKVAAMKQIPLAVVHQRSKNMYLNKQCKIPVCRRKSDMLLSSNPSAQVVLSERKMEIKELESQVSCLKEKIKELKIENKTLASIQARQERELRKYETGIADIPSLMKDHKDEKKVLEFNLNSIKNELKDSQKELKLKQEALLRKHKQVEKLNMEVRKCNITKQNLNVEIKNLKLGNKKHEEEINELRSENQKLKSNIQLIMKNVVDLKANPENYIDKDLEELFSRMGMNENLEEIEDDLSRLNEQTFVVTQCTEKEIRQPVLDEDSKDEDDLSSLIEQNFEITQHSEGEVRQPALDKDLKDDLKEVNMERNLCSSPKHEKIMFISSDNEVISETERLYFAKSSPKALCVDVKNSETCGYPMPNTATPSNTRHSSRENSEENIVIKTGNSKTPSFADYFTKESAALCSEEIKSTNPVSQKNSLTAVESSRENIKEDSFVMSGNISRNSKTASFADCFTEKSPALHLKEIRSTEPESQKSSLTSIKVIGKESEEDRFLMADNISPGSKIAYFADYFARESAVLLSKQIKSADPAYRKNPLLPIKSTRLDSEESGFLKSGNVFQNSKPASFAEYFTKESAALHSKEIKPTDLAFQRKSLPAIETTRKGKGDGFLKSGNVLENSKTASLADYFRKEPSVLCSKEIKPTDLASHTSSLNVVKSEQVTENEGLISEEVFDFSEPEVFSTPEYVKINNTTQKKSSFCPGLLEKSSDKFTPLTDMPDKSASALDYFYSAVNRSNTSEKYLYNSRIFDEYLKKHSWKHYN